MHLSSLPASDILTWIALIAQLVFLEGVLSIDNVAVLGALVAPLPADSEVPWPSALRGAGHRIRTLLGGQQQAALRVGLLGAYLGRGLMLLAADIVIHHTWLHVLGGAYLLYLAADHLTNDSGASSAHQPLDMVGQRRHFWHVVLAVELTDLVFSLDNVVAAVALSTDIVIVMIGVGLGIATVRVAAGVFTTLIHHEPILEPATYFLLLVIGMRLILSATLHLTVPAPVQFVLSVSILGGAVIYAHWYPLRAVMQPALRAGAHILRVSTIVVNRVVVSPVAAVVHLLMTNERRE